MGNINLTFFQPPSNDGAALGTTSLQFSDLFLASGAVINFANGDLTLTHLAGGRLTLRNPTASTGVTDIIVKAGAGNASGGNPYMFQVQKNDATLMLGVSPLGVFVNNSRINFGDSNVDYPISFIVKNSYQALDFVAVSAADNVGHGAFNFELGGNQYAFTSGTGSYVWFGENSGTYGYTPTSGTGVFNGLWINWLFNQTGGASGITRGIYVNPILTAVADYRGIEVANAGTTQTALKTGTGFVKFGGPIEMVEITAPSAPAANTARLYCEDSGGGKTRLMALFPSGAAQQIAIEP